WMPRCFWYQALKAVASSALKKMPPMPITRFIFSPFRLLLKLIVTGLIALCLLTGCYFLMLRCVTCATESFHAFGHLLRRYVFDMSCQRPRMPEGIGKRAHPVTIKLILQRTLNFCSGINGTLKYGVHIFNIQQQ